MTWHTVCIQFPSSTQTANIDVPGRLQFLDDTLKNIIDRFEAEYPDTRVSHQEAMGGSPASTPSSSPPPSLLSSSGPTPSSLKDTDSFTNSNAVDDSDEEEPPQRPGRHSRKSSDVSLASRKMGYEEGRMHKLGHAIRQDILRPSAPESEASGANSPFPAENTAKPHAPEPAEIAELKRKLENLQGTELMQEVRQRGWEEVMRQIGSNIEELKALRYAGEMGELGEEEERDWQNFREAQEKAYRNSLRAKEEGEETRKGKTDSAILE